MTLSIVTKIYPVDSKVPPRDRGADVKSFSDLPGHATVTAELNMYVHPGLEKKRKCLGLLDMV